MKPILEELDETCPLNRPVPIDRLLALFKKHAQLDAIYLVRVSASQIRGVHLGPRDKKAPRILLQRCETHHNKEPDVSCPACQFERYVIAKELVHTLDTDGEKTPPNAAAGMLIDQLIRGALNESAQVEADGWGQIWALELLARYRHRLLYMGGVLGTSAALTNARQSGNYSYIASKYGVPQGLISHAFSERYMSVMKEIRQSVGLPITVEPAEGGV